MSLSPAPFFDDLAGDTPPGTAYWADTADGIRIRIATWNTDDAPHGTVLLFPGRTEYIEKYCNAAGEFAARGFATLAVDWRGQGLGQRLLDDPSVGHVEDFTDYQNDVDAVVKAAEQLNLPKPWHLLGHSMGGCIGLRAAMQGLPVASCAFSAPMWGIFMSRFLRPIGTMTAYGGTKLGMGGKLILTGKSEGYVKTQDFKGNTLTTDPEMYAMMQEHLDLHPELSLGGPSNLWLNQALSETAYLAQQPSPDLPCVTLLGTEEKIVDSKRIHDRMAIWPKGELDLIQGAEHEVLMEVPDMRIPAFDKMATLFRTASSAG